MKPDKDEKKTHGNFTKIPNMLCEGAYPDLEPDEKWLYVCVKALCKGKGTRFLSLRYIAKKTGYSLSTLSKKLPRLQKAGLIHCEFKKRLDEDGNEYGNAQYHITIADKWDENDAFYGVTCSQDEQVEGEDSKPVHDTNEPVHVVNTSVPAVNEPVHGEERTCSRGDTSKDSEDSEDTEKIAEDKKEKSAYAQAHAHATKKVNTGINYPTIAATTQDMVGEAKLDMLTDRHLEHSCGENCEICAQAQQQGDEDATTTRSDTRISVGAGHRASVPSVGRHAAETEVGGSQGSQTSRTPAEAVRPGEAAREEGISDESHPTRDISDGSLVDANGVRRGVEAVAGAPAQSVDISSSLPPNVDGAVGSAPQSSGPRRSGKKKAEQDTVTPAKSDTKEVQRRINEHRGYALEEKVDLIREREAVKTWCSLHEIGDFDITMQYIKQDTYWSKPENYYRFGGLNLIKETPKALAWWARRKPAPKPKEANPVESKPLPVLAPIRGERKR